ncbi:glycosyl transferase [Mycolicibacter engbaekii]|uniref:Glycosyl transferase n=1 Tax=Mycolicibacter engbaekii TaxID=188915 RepID=A0A1X1U837_9MYCO|nr:glycosyltransferase [Mycolicibacter engbaekii]ORV52980.1 glycosyl transferase [Mycolicibacter engbaekii]
MSDPANTPTICLNMIVRDEAHIVQEVLTATAPYISAWVIVDTGSQDGTQQVIRDHMAALGIPGELYERPWRNFGHNRTEALTLAQGRCDYIWVIDADDTIVGTPDFTGLDADVYEMCIRQEAVTGWRPQVFRDGLPVRYVGVVHEFIQCDEDHVIARLSSEFAIESRRLGARSLDPQTYARDRDLLLAEVERNPEDSRSVFYLAQSCFDAEDYAAAIKWYERRTEMGGYDEEVYFSMYRKAGAMEVLGEPWPEVQAAYLRAWEYRPTRAEPLYCIAFAYRSAGRYRLGHLFAKQAMEIPMPNDQLFVDAGVYTLRAIDERAVCASWLGEHEEAFTLCRDLVARSDVPDDERQRIAANRDYSVPAMLDAASGYPEAVVRNLVAGPPDAQVTLTLRTGADLAGAEATLNSFLHCCLDLARVGRFLVIDTGLSAEDRALLAQRYPFLEFADPDTQIIDQIGGRYWLALDSGWRFFAPENLITRLTGGLQAEPQVFQIGVNFTDAVKLTGTCGPEDLVRRTPDAGRYLLTDTPATGPAMVDTTRLYRVGGTASLDEVLCILE